MIRSGGVERTKASRKVLFTADICMVSAARTLRKRQVARYIGVAENDIVSMSNIGGSMNVLNHMIVIDRQNRAVVLAIRGTYSVSDMLIDSSAFTTDFCFGRAHKGKKICLPFDSLIFLVRIPPNLKLYSAYL